MRYRLRTLPIVLASLTDQLTDQARNVLLFSNEEPRRFNHEYIGTEHILLGLLKENSGVAAVVLRKIFGDSIQTQLERYIIRETEKPTLVSGLPLTPRADRAIDYAVEEAWKLDHDFLSTAHILLGLLRESDSLPFQVLLVVGVEPASIQRELLSILGDPR